MDRRLFFKNLLGGSAAVAIAPKLFDQIVEQEYMPPDDRATQPPPEMVFNSDAGIWIFSGEDLIAYGGYQGVTLEFKREMIDVSRNPIYSTPEDPVPPWKEYIPGPMEGTWYVKDLIVKDPYQMLKINTPVHIVCRTPEHGTIESDAVCRLISAHSVTMTQSLWKLVFDIVGEAIKYV